MESVDDNAFNKLTAWAGYQYIRKVQCPNTWQYKAEKQVIYQKGWKPHFNFVLTGFFSFIATKRNAPELYWPAEACGHCDVSQPYQSGKRSNL